VIVRQAPLLSDEINHTVEDRLSLGFLSHEGDLFPDIVCDSPAQKTGLDPGLSFGQSTNGDDRHRYCATRSLPIAAHLSP
jgi:hypothetical protein